MTVARATLYVVATPLGNAEDITTRALSVLESVDLVCAEDTRVTRKLLRRHGMDKRLLSMFEHNEALRTSAVLEQLRSGRSVALVSSAGTPGLSDPGYRLISAAVEAGINVSPVPGPSALVAALSASGLPMERFCFSSFPPRRGPKRMRRLASLAAFPGTVVIYESPRRLAALCEDVLEAFGDRDAVVARELTKEHEEFIRGRLGELAERFRASPPLGEVTLMIAGPAEDEAEAVATADTIRAAKRPDETPSQAARRLGRRFGMTRAEVYAMLSGKRES